MSSLDTVVSDIYDLFDPENDHECSDENIHLFCKTLEDVLRSRLEKQQARSGALRFSSIGKKDRQIWYAANPDPSNPPEKMLPKTYLKFLYGDVIEALLLFLVREAGHSVKHEQGEVEINGVKGHIDAIIDGTVVDVKSASPYSYKKFEDNLVPAGDDPFGYVAQLSGYATVLTPGEKAAWLAMDKVGGDICVSYLPATIIKHHPPEDRINELKDIISREEPPVRCYEDEPDGKSGNRKLGIGCSYCAEKYRCWDGLRGFAYSNGPRFLTRVAREPDVPEIT